MRNIVELVEGETKGESTMWETLSAPWKLCLEQSWKAYCSGTIPIGAVILNASNELIASGRNRIFDKSAPLKQVAGSKLAHAEINALLQIPPDDENVGTYSLYTAVEPCPLCSGALYMSGIREVHFAARDSHAGSTNMYGKTAYLARKAMRVFGPTRELEAVVLVLNMDYFLRQSSRHPTGILMDHWQNDCPQAVSIAQKCFEDGWLQFAATKGLTAAEVVNSLHVALRLEDVGSR